MNTDCWVHIFSFLDMKTKMRCESVSRSFQQLVLASLSRQESLQTESCATSHKNQPLDAIPIALVSYNKCRNQMMTLLSKCPNLKDIRIVTMNATQHPGQYVCLIVDLCNKLETLDVKFPNMRITMSGPVFDRNMEEAYQVMKEKVPFLKHLSLPFCRADRLTQILQTWPLQTLSITVFDQPVTADHLKFVTENLTSFSGTVMMTESGIEKLIQTCKHLKRLSTGPLSNESVNLIAYGMPQLRHLSIGLVRHFDVESFPSCAHFANLSTIHLYTDCHKHFDGALLKLLRETGKTLRDVKLAGFLITDLSLSFVSLLAPNIVKLRIKKSIFLPRPDEPGITDDSFKSFTRFNCIQSIDIDTPNRVSESGITFLFSHSSTSRDIHYLRIWDAGRGTISRNSLQVIGQYCRRNVQPDRLLTVWLDHRISSQAVAAAAAAGNEQDWSQEHDADEFHDEDVRHNNNAAVAAPDPNSSLITEANGIPMMMRSGERQTHESLRQDVRLLLHQFNSFERPENLHLKVRLYCESLVFQ